MGPELPNNCCRPDCRYAALLTIDDQQTERGKRVMFPRTDVAELVDDLKPSPGVGLDAKKPLANYPTAARRSTSEACGSSKNIGVYRGYRGRAGKRRRRIGEAGDRAFGRL